MTTQHKIEPKWWKESTIYQIWPASYKDSNGDGVGDIPGIISKLDYLKDLGVDIVWLSPMYASPQIDMGYDISDYQAIYPPYGTMDDMDALISGLHERDMKILVDLVINHTSDQHEWFKESRSSKTNPKRDWYHWQPAKYDENGNRQPPNNWASHFGGSAWEWDELTQEYYLHLFCIEQPDINWENDECRWFVYDNAIKYWLDKGCDGFRIDTAGLYSKVPGYPDVPIVDPSSEFQPSNPATHNGPRIHEFIHEMNQRVFSKYDCMTVGEVGSGNVDDIVKYCGASRKEIDEMFIFNHTNVGRNPNISYHLIPWTLPDLKKAIVSTFGFVEDTDAWSTVYLENHDQPRSITRFGSDDPKYRSISGKMLALMEITLSGTLYIYQGQEIGMTNAKGWSIEDYKDVDVLNRWNILLEHNASEKAKAEFKEGVDLLSRDHGRTPVQWSAEENAGFSTAKPWIRVNDNYKTVNAASELADPASLRNYWKKVVSIRKEHKDIFVYGLKFTEYFHEDEKLFSYSKKSADGKQVFVVLNFSEDETTYEIPIEGKLKLLISSYDDEEGVDTKLRAFEGKVFFVEQ